jgi:Glycosyl hydrolases family 43
MLLRHSRAILAAPLAPLLLATGLAAGLSVAVPAGSAVASAAAEPASAATATWVPVHSGDFADPSIMAYDDVYYAFSTQNFAPASQTVNIQTSTSTNGVTWSESKTDALPTLPGWAIAGNTWAPSVAHVASTGQFVMYYVAQRRSDGDECIGRAVATAPLGPYVDDSTAPVVCQDGQSSAAADGTANYGGSIDPDIFIDNGSATLLWKSDGNHVGIDSYIWSQPLSTNLLTLQGSPVPIMDADQAWQDGIVEGPDMVDHDGTDYLFYSGNDEGSASYAIGYAVCTGGPGESCTDGSDNPILSSSSGLSGPGGPDFFLSPGDQSELAFSAWQGTTIGYLACGLRPMYEASVTFTDDGPALSPATSAGPVTNPSCAPAPTNPGYWQVASDGGIFSFGSAQFYGSTGGRRLNRPIVGMVATPDRRGYWLVASDGGVFAFGDAGFFGSTGALRLNEPIVGMVSTFDGRGYWLIASDGGVFAFGDAHFYGSLGGGSGSASPVTAMAPGFLGGGYWMVTASGQVFAFGNATNFGSLSSAPGGYRVTGMATTDDSNGYWLASANGNVVPFGDAVNYGSAYSSSSSSSSPSSSSSVPLNAPVVGMTATSDGAGYWLQGADGGIFSYGDAAFEGSMGGQRLNAPMVGIASATD